MYCSLSTVHYLWKVNFSTFCSFKLLFSYMHKIHVHVDHQCYSDNFDISHSILKTDLFSILGLDCSLIHTQNDLHSSVKDMININCVFIESLCFAGSRDNWHDLRLANPLYLLRKCLWSVYVIFNLNNEYVTLCRNTAVETIFRGTLKQDGCQSWH